jgi:cytochrome c-type biogenesis protein CcmE
MNQRSKVPLLIMLLILARLGGATTDVVAAAEERIDSLTEDRVLLDDDRPQESHSRLKLGGKGRGHTRGARGPKVSGRHAA